MKIDDQWDTDFLGYVCMHSVQAGMVIIYTSVAVFRKISVSNQSVIISFFVKLIVILIVDFCCHARQTF